jgi:hypothetical protein
LRAIMSAAVDRVLQRSALCEAQVTGLA